MVDKNVVREGYDQLSETYSEHRSAADGERAILDQFCSSLPADARVLDAGCGQGVPVLRQLSEGNAAVGIDVSRRQLDGASERVPAAEVGQADMTRLPFQADTYDGITAFHSLIHVPIDQHQNVIEEFGRLLIPGGRLLLTEGTNEWEGTNLDWLDTGVEMQWEIAGPEATREQLRAAGFRITDESTAVDDLADDGAEWTFFTARLEAR